MTVRVSRTEQARPGKETVKGPAGSDGEAGTILGPSVRF